MKDLKRVFGFELKKIKHNKLMIVILAVLLAVVILAPTVNYFCIMQAQPKVSEDKQAVLLKYQKDLEEYEKVLIEYAGSLSSEDIETYTDICENLRFFINSGTIKSDYLNSDSLAAKYENRECIGFMFYFGEISTFFLWALGIAAAAYLFVFDYHTHTLKNICASRISRNKIFASKLLFLLAFLTVVFLILTFFPLAFGLSQNNAKLFILHNNNYCAISAVTAFIAKAVATYVVTLALMAISIFSGIMLKNIVISIATPGVMFGLTFLMYLTIGDAVAANSILGKINYLDKIPILNLQFHLGAFDWRFIITLATHMVFAALLLFFASRKFNKQDL